jgi:hypothetical protein
MPYLNQSQLLKQGWTRALIAAILGKPDSTEHHQRGYQKWTENLYVGSRVEAGTQDPRFVALQSKRKARAANAERRRQELPKKYPSWRAALPEAALYLKSLNRYAKHRKCSELQKAEIYQLKNDLMELLYRKGFCTAAWIHVLQLEEQICRECSGGGEFCGRCDGSGISRAAKAVEFWTFRFLIEGKTYVWHRPADQVTFEPIATLPPSDFDGVAHEKPVALPIRRFKMAKDLIRLVLDMAAGEEAAVVQPQEIAELPFDLPSSLSASPIVIEQPILFPM